MLEGSPAHNPVAGGVESEDPTIEPESIYHVTQAAAGETPTAENSRGSSGGIRTPDQSVNSRPLYH